MAPDLADVLRHDPVRAARSLLGSTLRNGSVAVRVTETEAYDGESDEASHSFRGPTARNRVMFGPAGRLYVYFSYGMHFAVNVVCGPEGRGAAVLLRSGEVVDGIEQARTRRGARTADRDLARGPGRLTQALGIDRSHDGLDVLTGGPISLTVADPPVRTVSAGPRVGITRSAELPWRFWITDDRFVSAFRPGKPRRRLAP